MSDTASATNTPLEDRPLLFISHRHDDKALADAVRQCLQNFTGGRIRVYQSSSAAAVGPEGGRSLTAQLKEALYAASALILLYTEPTEDWQYCMWEVGVANHPQSRETKIILFECASQVPKVFEGEARVNIRDKEQLLRFVNGVFTQDGFFPGYGKSTDFTPGGDEVRAAAIDLFSRITQLLQPETRAAGDWPSCPFLRLSIKFDDLDTIEQAGKAGQQQCLETTLSILDKTVTVLTGDGFAARLFGLQGAESLKGIKFGELVATWKSRCPVPYLDWLEALARQLMQSAQEQFPRQTWQMMRSADEDDSTRVYSPAVMRVQTRPARRWKEFDVYFCKFSLTPDGAVQIGAVPSSG